MGSELRIDSVNNANRAEILHSSYDKVHGITEEPSIWEHFTPMALGGSVLFPLLFNSKEFKHVKLDSSLTRPELQRNKYRMIRLNELEHSLDFLKLNKTVVDGKKVVDPFLQSELLNLKHDINIAKNHGAISKSALTDFNMKYFNIVDNTTSWKKSPFQKALVKVAKICPNYAGEFAKAFKNNKIMLLFETFLEVGEVFNAFTTPAPGQIGGGLNIEAGTKQLVKSVGRVAVGYTGFAAGTAMGLKIGAMLGSVIPGAGTVMGGIIGSAIGFAVGGVVSQLSKSVYNKIIPDTKTEMKNTTISSILDSSDKSEEAKNILATEIASANDELTEISNTIALAQQSNDNTQIEESNKDKQVIEKARDTMVEIYQKKFGENLLTQTEKTDNSGKSVQQALPAQQTQSLQQPIFNTPLQNQMLVSNSSMQDWSSMLPLNVQQNLFATAA